LPNGDRAIRNSTKTKIPGFIIVVCPPALVNKQLMAVSRNS
jgi:hypothetical protein